MIKPTLVDEKDVIKGVLDNGADFSYCTEKTQDKLIKEICERILLIEEKK